MAIEMPKVGFENDVTQKLEGAGIPQLFSGGQMFLIPHG